MKYCSLRRGYALALLVISGSLASAQDNRRDNDRVADSDPRTVPVAKLAIIHKQAKDGEARANERAESQLKGIAEARQEFEKAVRNKDQAAMTRALDQEQRARFERDRQWIIQQQMKATRKEAEFRASSENVTLPAAQRDRPTAGPLGHRPQEPPRRADSVSPDKAYSAAELHNLRRIALNLGLVTDILARRARIEDARRQFGEDGDGVIQLLNSAYDGAAAIRRGLVVRESRPDDESRSGFGQKVQRPDGSKVERTTRIKELTQELIALNKLAEAFKASGASQSQIDDFNRRLTSAVAELNALGVELPAIGTIQVPSQ